jgi:hypothetical protein
MGHSDGIETGDLGTEEGDADSGTDGSGDGDGHGDGDGDGDYLPSCPENDEWEVNDLPENASAVPWSNLKESDAYWALDAFLCAEEDDWYFVAVEELTFNFYALYVHALVEGSGLCDGWCGDPFLPEAPENTIAIAVYDADTMTLLGEGMAEDGSFHGHHFYFVEIDPMVAHDLLIRVHGLTPVARYAYQLDVHVGGGEDECEC